jgi:molybdopterin-guanine dinucleotide biosynthesis protein A
MTDIPGVLLAGGLARRMGGGDKPMRTIAGRTILDRVIARLKPQCGGLILNANGDPARFATFGLPVIPDGVADFPGPLAGILAALDWAAANRPDVKLVLSAAADCPFLPRDLVSRLYGALEAEKAELAVAASDGQSHPVIGLWSVGLREELRHAQSLRKIEVWTARHGVALAMAGQTGDRFQRQYARGRRYSGIHCSAASELKCRLIWGHDNGPDQGRRLFSGG